MKIMQYISHYDSPMGGITLASDGHALTGLWFDGQKHFAATLEPQHEHKDLPIFGEAEKWLDCYFAGKTTPPSPKLAPRGSEFRQQVWNILLKIPYGKLTTYLDIAKEIAQTRGLKHFSAQAVGGAVAHNAIALMIPCHRVLGANGQLTGYAGGIDKKIRLLNLEGIDINTAGVEPRVIKPDIE